MGPEPCLEPVPPLYTGRQARCGGGVIGWMVLWSLGPASASEFDLGLMAFEVVLPTGFRIVLQPSPGAGTVGISTIHEVGSGDDPADQPGVAHLVEHLWFRSHGPDGAPAMELLEQMGCNVNASTGLDTTAYHSACPADGFARALRIHGGRLADPLPGVTQEDLDAERRVVGACWWAAMLGSSPRCTDRSTRCWRAWAVRW